MRRSSATATSIAAVLNPLAVLSPLAGIAASLTGALPARGVDVQFTERVISTTADRAVSVFATCHTRTRWRVMRTAIGRSGSYTDPPKYC